MSDKHADKIISLLTKELEKAMKDGNEAVSTFLSATAFSLGAMIPLCVDQKGYGDLTSELIKALGTGIQSGIEILGANSSMTIVKGKMVH